MSPDSLRARRIGTRLIAAAVWKRLQPAVQRRRVVDAAQRRAMTRYPSPSPQDI
ncbi:hypothetical protein J2S69_002434 [Glycomyces lechevalierae]|uniref:Uncharacterized protein n=1 Tax=Glycomyces lechevalierae TaxID=256034 RepID=A0ABU2ANE6_9ACTN|nr:hypothetical protein [Glycomyces lechevalierae]